MNTTNTTNTIRLLDVLTVESVGYSYTYGNTYKLVKNMYGHYVTKQVLKDYAIYLHEEVLEYIVEVECPTDFSKVRYGIEVSTNILLSNDDIFKAYVDEYWKGE